MAEACERNSPFQGEVEADESYFGPRRVRGKRGRGAAGKTIVFGLLKRGKEVYTEIVPNASKAALQAVIRGRVGSESVLHTDGWRGYDGLVDLGFDKHFRVNHSENEFARGSHHVNGIPRHTFYLHLKETEFRFNHRQNDLYKILLSALEITHSKPSASY